MGDTKLNGGRNDGTSRGFTLVELIVVIVVIAILAALITVGVQSYMRDGRDTQRASSVATLSEALEKYYDKKGEYPSCPLITSAPDTVSSALGIDQSAIKMPQSAAANSLSCTDITPSITTDTLAYVGDSSSQCQTGSACLSYTLKYKSEATGQIQSSSSRRVVNVPTAPAAPESAIVAAISGTTATGTASTVACNQATTQYRLGTRTNAAAWVMGGWQTATSISLPAAEGSQYSFMVETRCVLSGGVIGDVTTGNVASVVRGINAPAAPIVTSSLTGSGASDSVVWSWTAVTCPAGTSAEYSSAYFRDDATAWRSWTAVSTTRTYTLATNYQGYEYQLKARARCKTTYATSNFSTDSNTTAYTRVVDAPGLASGFTVDKQTYNSSSGGGTYESTRVWWDTSPTCGLGTSRRIQVAGWVNVTSPAFANGYAGGGGQFIFQTDASTPLSSLSPGNDPSFSRQEYRYRTAWDNLIVPAYKDPAQAPALSDTYYWKTWVPTSSSPVSVGSAISYLDGTSTYLRGARAYVRYACLNTTTDRYAIGQPAMSNWRDW